MIALASFDIGHLNKFLKEERYRGYLSVEKCGNRIAKSRKP